MSRKFQFSSEGDKMSVNKEQIWDAFISHASEDKAEFVMPLYEVLSRFSLEVWYDEAALEPGDSLVESIDRGLSTCKYGIVVFSKSFFQKNWTRYELLTLSEKGKDNNNIIPVLFGIERDELLDEHPELTDILSIDANNKTLEIVASEIISVVRPEIFERINRRVAMMNVSGELGTLSIEDIHRPPHLHKDLNPNLISRIRLIRASLLGTYDHSMSYWIDSFKRERHPSREVTWWEHVAAVYNETISIIPLDNDERKKLFRIIISLEHITCEEQIEELSDGLAPNLFDIVHESFRRVLPAFDFDEKLPSDAPLPPDAIKMFSDIEKESEDNPLPHEIISVLSSHIKGK
jgi:hypothetical protein